MRIHLFSCLLFISLIQILPPAFVSCQCIDDQRLLLLQLKSSLVFNSNASTKLVNWNQSADCCKWDGVDCDGDGRVISLNLESESISGGIENSTALFVFQHLQRLNLAFNFFGGALIPKGLQNLTNLIYLNLSNAGFGGQVPIEVSTLKNLDVLDLSTLFGGPQSLKLEKPNLLELVQNLSELRGLYLDYVDISGQRSEWCQVLSSYLPNLSILSMRSCGLSGPLDSSLAGLQFLSVLRLDRNNLSTTVPEFMARFSNLKILTLGSCFLQGTFPDIMFQVRTLQTLDLSFNNLLSGTIQQFPPNSSFRIMVLSNTNFSGSLPISISNARMLSKIDLSKSNFTGLLPFTISNLTELEYMDLSFNSFVGPIPPFSFSNKLTYLDLSHNSLNGSLSPNHFEGLSNLTSLNLGFNNLTGSIPPFLFGLHSLKRLQLLNNKFSGQIDEYSILNSSVLGTIDLSSNQLQGSIPEFFFRIKGLNVLSLSSNRFNGNLKLEMFNRLGYLTKLELGYNNLSVDTRISSLMGLPQLSTLDLASCNLYSFPDLSSQSKLIYLDLSNNHIEGELPSWVWSIGDGAIYHLNLSMNLLVGLDKPVKMSPFLYVIDLHSNKLQGELPMLPESAVYVDYSSNNFQNPIPANILNSSSYLTFFSLANNSLTGTIPETLCNAASIQVLDLSNNQLTGSIPPCLVRNNVTLGVLNMRRNKISGKIPDAFSVNCSLKTLDLSYNNLDGTVPSSMANCKSLEVVNVGNNKIDGTFPCFLKNSTSLRVLVLRNNKFYGSLDCVGVHESWPNLQIIDIASNNFSGELHPNCITSWRGMMQEDGAHLGGNHLHFEFLNLGNFYYQDAVMVTVKGLELELLKILTVFTAIDFSCNNFSGEIPETVGYLSSLYVLNLSRNSFSGGIPSSSGNLTQLGSLDLSWNQLTGEIPRTLESLTFLSFLNLSYNKLYGMIPTGPQFSTFTAESFAGNSGLCGFQLNISCSSDQPSPYKTRRWNSIDFNWQFIVTGLGFGVGASFILAPLIFCKQWREKCDEQIDQILKLICPSYGFSYVRYDSKVAAIENYKDEMTDDDDDDDDEGDTGSTIHSGKYCIFCTKLDAQIKSAIHNPNCTCQNSPPKLSTSSSSSSSLLVIYH